MKTCSWFKQVEAFVDAELADSSNVEAHLDACAACRDHHDELLQWRAAVRFEAPQLSDQQFPVFMEGIRSGISETPPRARGFWALASLVAAALVIAVATFSIFNGTPPAPVQANEIESISTQIEGATVEWGDSGSGVTSIWVSIAEDDL